MDPRAAAYHLPSYGSAFTKSHDDPHGVFSVTDQEHLHYQKLRMFWDNQVQEIQQMKELKGHSLPLARVKKIMKEDENVGMICAEGPAVLAKACEFFILDLSFRSWTQTHHDKRRTLQKKDIASAITETDVFDFLIDIIPRNKLILEEDSVGLKSECMPYYYFNNNNYAPQPLGTPGSFPGLVAGSKSIGTSGVQVGNITQGPMAATPAWEGGYH